MPKIVVIGSFNVDLITYVKKMPRPGETVTDGEFHTMPGGKGSNQAVGAARLGADVTFIGSVGSDQFAQMGFDLWREAGIKTDYVNQETDSATGTALILVDAEGENSIAVAPGANRKLEKRHVDAARDAIANADVLMAQLEVPLEVVKYAFEIARQEKTIILLNPAPVHEKVADVQPLVDYITPNEWEKSTLAPLKPEQVLVTTRGGKGAEIQQGNNTQSIPAFDVDVLDTVGGGDAFNAGLAVALAEGKDLKAAVLFANAVAGLAVTKRGAASSMPTRAEVETLLEQQS